MPNAATKLFSVRMIAVALALALVTGWAANGPVWGVVHLQALVPGVTIPDVTPWYTPQELPGFFQAMGESGRAAYRTLNTFDFLLIISYTLVVVTAIGTLLRYLLPGRRHTAWLAVLAVLPGLFDAIESSCFRIIVSSPYSAHTAASNVAALTTKAKFLAMYLTLLALAGLLIAGLVTWRKRRADT